MMSVCEGVLVTISFDPFFSPFLHRFVTPGVAIGVIRATLRWLVVTPRSVLTLLVLSVTLGPLI